METIREEYDQKIIEKENEIKELMNDTITIIKEEKDKMEEELNKTIEINNKLKAKDKIQVGLLHAKQKESNLLRSETLQLTEKLDEQAQIYSMLQQRHENQISEYESLVNRSQQWNQYLLNAEEKNAKFVQLEVINFFVIFLFLFYFVFIIIYYCIVNIYYYLFLIFIYFSF